MLRDEPSPAPRRVLVLGGARSGKSRYALDLAEGSGLAPVFIATAEARDEEMAGRIERHQRDRGERWQTLVASHALAAAIAAESTADTVVLVD